LKGASGLSLWACRGTPASAALEFNTLKQQKEIFNISVPSDAPLSAHAPLNQHSELVQRAEELMPAVQQLVSTLAIVVPGDTLAAVVEGLASIHLHPECPSSCILCHISFSLTGYVPATAQQSQIHHSGVLGSIYNGIEQDENRVSAVCIGCHRLFSPEDQAAFTLRRTIADKQLGWFLAFLRRFDRPVLHLPKPKYDERSASFGFDIEYLQATFGCCTPFHKILRGSPFNVSANGPIPTATIEDELVKVFTSNNEKDRSAAVEWATKRVAYDQWERIMTNKEKGDLTAAARALAVEMVEDALEPSEVGNNPYYVQVTLGKDSEISSIINNEWILGDEQGSMFAKWVEDKGQNFAHWGVLAFIGGKGRVTPFHEDHSSAINVGYRIQVPPESTPWPAGKKRASTTQEPPFDSVPLARWTCIMPPAIPLAREWIAKNKMGGRWILGFREAKENMPILSAQEVFQLQAFVSKKIGDDPHSRLPYVLDFFQMHGEWVQVHAGVMHQVETLCPSLKLAWDVYAVKLFAMYIALWRDVITIHTANGQTAWDYMDLQLILVDATIELAQFMGLTPVVLQ
jgi:hypothetical protein